MTMTTTTTMTIPTSSSQWPKQPRQRAHPPRLILALDRSNQQQHTEEHDDGSNIHNNHNNHNNHEDLLLPSHSYHPPPPASMGGGGSAAGDVSSTCRSWCTSFSGASSSYSHRNSNLATRLRRLKRRQFLEAVGMAEPEPPLLWPSQPQPPQPTLQDKSPPDLLLSSSTEHTQEQTDKTPNPPPCTRESESEETKNEETETDGGTCTRSTVDKARQRLRRESRRTSSSVKDYVSLSTLSSCWSSSSNSYKKKKKIYLNYDDKSTSSTTTTNTTQPSSNFNIYLILQAMVLLLQVVLLYRHHQYRASIVPISKQAVQVATASSSSLETHDKAFLPRTCQRRKMETVGGDQYFQNYSSCGCSDDNDDDDISTTADTANNDDEKGEATTTSTKTTPKTSGTHIISGLSSSSKLTCSSLEDSPQSVDSHESIPKTQPQKKYEEKDSFSLSMSS